MFTCDLLGGGGVNGVRAPLRPLKRRATPVRTDGWTEEQLFPELQPRYITYIPPTTRREVQRVRDGTDETGAENRQMQKKILDMKTRRLPQRQSAVEVDAALTA